MARPAAWAGACLPTTPQYGIFYNIRSKCLVRIDLSRIKLISYFLKNENLNFAFYPERQLKFEWLEA
jgi:hypothetical protein